MGKNSFSLLIFSEAPNKKAKDDENKEDSMEDEWDDWLVGKSSLILLFSLLTDSKVEVHRSKKSPYGSAFSFLVTLSFPLFFQPDRHCVLQFFLKPSPRARYSFTISSV